VFGYELFLACLCGINQLPRRALGRIPQPETKFLQSIAKYLLEVGIEPRAERLPRQRQGQIPFGMKMRGGQLTVHVGEHAIVLKLLQMRAEGKSHSDLVDWLNANGIRTKNGGKWDRPTVFKILKRNLE